MLWLNGRGQGQLLRSVKVLLLCPHNSWVTRRAPSRETLTMAVSWNHDQRSFLILMSLYGERSRYLYSKMCCTGEWMRSLWTKVELDCCVSVVKSHDEAGTLKEGSELSERPWSVKCDKPVSWSKTNPAMWNQFNHTFVHLHCDTLWKNRSKMWKQLNNFT